MSLTERLVKGSALTAAEHDGNLQYFVDGLAGKADDDDPRLSGVIRPEDYSLGSNELNLNAAFAAGISTGKPVRLDGSYTISSAISTITMTTGRLIVIGHGNINCNVDLGVGVTIHAAYPTAVAVSAVAVESRSFPGTSTTACDATKLTATGHGLAVGDLIKVVSDDILAVTADTNPRRGEFAYVADVSGNNVYVAGYLLNTYTTNVRLVRVRTEAKLLWDGPRFTATPAQSGWDIEMLRVRGFAHPYIRSDFQDGYDIGLSLSSCYMAEAHVTGRNMRNRATSEGVSGYLMQDSACAYTRAYIAGTDARHSYTTDSPNPATNSNAYLYGQTYGAQITGSFHASSAAAFDTHTEAYDVTFANIVTGASRLGEAAAGSGAGLRGTRIRVVNGIDRGSTNGLQFGCEVAGGSVDCEAINWNYEGAGDGIRIGDGTTPNLIRPKVTGGRTRTSKNRSIAIWDCNDCTINGHALAPSGSATTTGIALGGDAQVTIVGLEIDLSGFTGTQFRAVSLTGTGNSVTLVRPRLTGGAGKFEAWVNGGSTSGSVTIIDPQSDVAPSAGDIINGGSLTSQTILGNMKPRSFAVAGLPSAVSEGVGTIVWTTNGNSGAACPAISDGTNWKRIALGATVSP